MCMHLCLQRVGSAWGDAGGRGEVGKWCSFLLWCGGGWCGGVVVCGDEWWCGDEGWCEGGLGKCETACFHV